MTEVLVATGGGCLVAAPGCEPTFELPGRAVRALTTAPGGVVLAVIDSGAIWRRSLGAGWEHVTTSPDPLVAIAHVEGWVLGATEGVSLLRIPMAGTAERLRGFETIPGRDQWFGQGPPLHVRSLTVTADGRGMMAAVHVGGIPLSSDGGTSWRPTLPVEHDVHEVRAHPSNPRFVAAATGAGPGISLDGGNTWRLVVDGPEVIHALAVAALEEDFLFSLQDGPFAARCQIWRIPAGGDRLEPVREGLPEWLGGKVDSGGMGASGTRAAIVDGSGDLWLSRRGSTGWEKIAGDVPYPNAVVVL